MKWEKAVPAPGLRLVVTDGIPGPWVESARGLLHVKSIDNAPVAVLDDEAPRAGWADIPDDQPPRCGNQAIAALPSAASQGAGAGWTRQRYLSP